MRFVEKYGCVTVVMHVKRLSIRYDFDFSDVFCDQSRKEAKFIFIMARSPKNRKEIANENEWRRETGKSFPKARTEGTVRQQSNQGSV